MATETAINQRTLSEINKCRETIREAERSIDRANRKIVTLRATPSTEWTENQILNILPGVITQQEAVKVSAVSRLEALKAGRLRREMVVLVEESKARQRELEEIHQSKRAARQETKDHQKQVYDQWRDGERRSRYEINSQKGHLRRGESYFWRVVEDFQSKNMAKNLPSMPNNRGYRYRGIDFYGELPAETNDDGTPKPTVITETVKGVQMIHEITREYHKVFRKTQRGRGGKRVLVSNTPRIPPGEASLMDFVVPRRRNN